MIKTKFFYILVLCLAVCTTACQPKANPLPEWPEEWKDPEQPQPEDPVNPEDPEDLEKEPEGAKPRYMWIDAAANFYYYANDRQQIADDLRKIKETGFTEVVVDIRPTEAVVLYKSKVAPEVKKLPAWIGGKYKMINRTESFDMLQAFIDSGHELGLKVNVSLNTFVGGSKGYYGLADIGPLYDGSIPKSWCSVVNTSEGLKNSMDICQGGVVFLSPTNDDVQAYVLKILAEVAAYDVDGIILDRCRFDDYSLMSDFSESSKTKFEAFYGQTVKNWPSDIFSPGKTTLPSILSNIQKRWLVFRVKTIHDFMVKAADTVHSVNRNVRFGVYVGAWYSTYYESGVNWASPKYKTSSKYGWADKDYSDYGFADHMDFMFLGCYASTSSIYGSGEWTMQGFAKQGKTLLSGDSVFAGGPDIGNSPGFENGGQGALLTKTIDAIINQADGYFCFDLCHVRMFDYWSAYRKGVDDYLNKLK